MNLSSRRCVPCEGGTQPLTVQECSIYLEQTPSWSVSLDEKSIEREFVFKNFEQSMTFINNVARIAEEEGHHPDVFLHRYRKVTITLSTHAIGGLSVNDFILASKIDHLLSA